MLDPCDSSTSLMIVQISMTFQLTWLFTSVPLILHLTKLWSFPSNLASSIFPKLRTLHLQPSRFSLACWNCKMRKKPSLPWHPKLRNGFLQCPSLIQNPLSPKTAQFYPSGILATSLPFILKLCRFFLPGPHPTTIIAPWNCADASSQGLLPQQSLPAEIVQLHLSVAMKNDDMQDDPQGDEEKDKQTKEPKLR